MLVSCKSYNKVTINSDLHRCKLSTRTKLAQSDSVPTTNIIKKHANIVTLCKFLYIPCLEGLDADKKISFPSINTPNKLNIQNRKVRLSCITRLRTD